jgi:hypothetical protein
MATGKPSALYRLIAAPGGVSFVLRPRAHPKQRGTNLFTVAEACLRHAIHTIDSRQEVILDTRLIDKISLENRVFFGWQKRGKRDRSYP